MVSAQKNFGISVGGALLLHLLLLVLIVFGMNHPVINSTPLTAEIWSETGLESAAPKPIIAPAPPPPPPAPSAVVIPPPEPVKPMVESPPHVDIAVKIPPLKIVQQEQAVHPEKKAILKRPLKQKLAEDLKQQQFEAHQEEQLDQLKEQADQEAKNDQAKIQSEALRGKKMTLIERYKQLIIQKIKNNTQVPEQVDAGVFLEVELTVLPTGEVMMPIKIIKASSNPAYDQAVLAGINRSQPLPLPDDVELRREFRKTYLRIKHEH
jgi:colicin import membrane protein